MSSGYGYDAISRLSSLTDDLSGTVDDLTTTLAYNPASQITSKSISNDSYVFGGYLNVSRSYGLNALNQYTTAGSAVFTYDANGNLTGDGTSSYGYDIENRLVSRSSGLSLAYDPNSRLWQTSGGPSGTTRYLYDGDELVAEYDGSGNLLRRYVHGSGDDDPQLWYEGAALTNRRSLQIDNEGSVVSVANTAGNVIAKDTYDEYGVPGSANIGRFQYTGQAWLPDLGMYYYKARIYSPTLGRFMQVDPVGYGDQVNLYAYVANDPINKTDPTGLEAGSCYGASGSSCGMSGGSLPSLDTVINVATVILVGIDILDGPTPDVGAAAIAARSAAQAEGREMTAVATKAEQRTFQTYTKTNPTTGERYIGRTSGTGTPAQNVARRDAAGYPSKDYGPARLDKSSTNPQAIKGREQQMIENNGGAQSQGGNSGNKINGISDRNPNGSACKAAASREFGPC